MAGTLATAVSLLVSEITIPPAGACWLSVTVPVTELPPVMPAGSRLCPECSGRSTVREAVWLSPAKEAVIMMGVVWLTELVVTLNVAVVAPSGTTKGSGTLATFQLLLCRETPAPPAGAGLTSVTVPVEEFPPVMLAGPIVSDDKDPGVALRLKKMSGLPGVSSVQTMLTLPAESVAISGDEVLPESLERFWGKEKVAPPSLDRLKKV